MTSVLRLGTWGVDSPVLSDWASLPCLRPRGTSDLRATGPKAYVCRNAEAADPLMCGAHEFTGVLRRRSSSGHECSSTGAWVSLGR